MVLQHTDDLHTCYSGSGDNESHHKLRTPPWTFQDTVKSCDCQCDSIPFRLIYIGVIMPHETRALSAGYRVHFQLNI